MARLPERKPVRRRVGAAWRRLKRALGFGGAPPEPPPPDEEPALVPVGSPRHPRPSSAVELELPEDPIDTDARGDTL